MKKVVRMEVLYARVPPDVKIWVKYEAQRNKVTECAFMRSLVMRIYNQDMIQKEQAAAKV